MCFEEEKPKMEFNEMIKGKILLICLMDYVFVVKYNRIKTLNIDMTCCEKMLWDFINQHLLLVLIIVSTVISLLMLMLASF